MNAKYALIAALSLASMPAAKSEDQPTAPIEVKAAETIRVKVVSADLDTQTFVVALDGKQRVFTFNERTKFTLDGKESTAARVLVAGRELDLSYAETVAVEVAAKSDE